MKRIRPSLTPLLRRGTTTLRAPLTRTFASEATAISPATDPNTSSTLPQLPYPPPCRTPSASAKLPALHARLSLHPSYPLETLGRALVDRSADSDARFNNASLAALGEQLTHYYITEHLMTVYPRLPSEILRAAVDSYVGFKAFAALGREWGIEAAYAPVSEVDAGLLQFKRVPPGAPTPVGFEGGVTLEYAMATAVKAVLAGVYLHEGMPALKQFFKQHVISRKLEIERMFDFKQPPRELSRLCAREGFEPPVGRLLSETGRYSRNAVFVVGVYSGAELMGEGHGGSLEEARVRAAVNALKGWYLYSPLEKTVPSATAVEKSKGWKPKFVDAGEVIV